MNFINAEKIKKSFKYIFGSDGEGDSDDVANDINEWPRFAPSQGSRNKVIRLWIDWVIAEKIFGLKDCHLIFDS